MKSSIWIAMATVVAASACASPDGVAPETSQGPVAAQPSPPPHSNIPSFPPPLEPSNPLPAPPVATPQPVDSCGAKDLQWLIGRPRSDIPPPVDPSRRRVVCTTCPATMDYRADRTTILYDTATEIVREIRCG